MSTKQSEVASVGGTFVTIDGVAGAERSGGFAVTVVAVVDVANDADDLADNADACSLRILLVLAVEVETMDTWCGLLLRIKLETCLVFVHWRTVFAAQAGHVVEPYLADKGGDQGRMSC